MIDYNFKPKEGRTDFGWYSRGYPPQFDGGAIPQFITFCLFDSIPQLLMGKWRAEVEDDAVYRKLIEEFLDSGHGSCRLVSVARRMAVLKAHFISRLDCEHTQPRLFTVQ